MYTRHFARHVFASILCAALVAAFPATSSAQAPTTTYTVLYLAEQTGGISFPGGEADAQGRDGNTYFGARGNPDTLFYITPGGTTNIVYSVGFGAASGATLGTDGNFYGTNVDGGPGGNCGFAGCGQVYQITPAGVETILHNFTGFADGAALYDAPIEGKAGKFYGTTPISNGQGISTAFSVTSSGTFTTLHDFTTAEGYPIYAGLVQGTDGNFYGVAYQGGANNYGTIFKMTPAGAVTVLHSFNNSDGARPSAPLIQVSDGNFYGSTILGGLGVGVIFKITPSGTYTVLHSINSSLGEGQGPNSSLTQATDGKLYGTTGRGTAGFLGTIFSVTTTGTFTTLYTFCPALTNCTDGYNPSSPLRQNTNGIFYGTTLTGGDYGCNGNGTGCGVVYSLDVGLKPFVSLVTTSGNEGAKIGILGQGFSSSSVVKFGGTQATTVTPSGTTFLTATVPAGALTGSVTVITGTTTLTSNLKFKVKPTFTTFSPPNGPVGTPVTITGTGLTQTTKVTFNGTSASFTVNSDTQVTATVPTGATTGKIMVTTKGGSVTSMTTFTVN